MELSVLHQRKAWGFINIANFNFTPTPRILNNRVGLRMCPNCDSFESFLELGNGGNGSGGVILHHSIHKVIGSQNMGTRSTKFFSKTELSDPFDKKRFLRKNCFKLLKRQLVLKAKSGGRGRFSSNSLRVYSGLVDQIFGTL